MYSITLISSFHKLHGKCNPVELYRRIEKIQPEVIFEELSEDTFRSIYTWGYVPQTTESIAIGEYLKNYPVKHFPVDTYPLTGDALLSDAQVIWEHSEEYREIWKQKLSLLKTEGYSFLNSDLCSDIVDKITAIEIEVLSKLGLTELSAELRAEQDLHAKREAVILENIYSYSKQHPYNKAVVILGAQHRKPIKQLIEQCQLSKELKLNWSFYNENQL